ncbi:MULTISPECIES: cytosine permease [unclassified Microbacterium]|uniref:cytosine permease n=1 Tax=unclassified Microbacterium TaxID=2609290 RepID=UPI000EA92425|nr:MULTISPECIES: cytosine permease [unclassified Microbacterium]MBT2484362.1 cytosine permease [Microbacterium sp. ISL-108]RKN67275.1 cytosine permease [Microbacterium sp. CGR2]
MTTTDYEHGIVPQDQRKSWLSIATVWIAIGIDLSGAFLGVALAAGMAFWPAIAATMLGSLLLGLLAMACAYVGAATGLSSAMISRAVFGKIGGAILALAIAISLIGWFAVQAGFFGTNAQIAFAEFTGIDVPVQVFTGIGAVLMAITAFWGYRSINRLSSLAVPLLLLLLIVGIVVAFTVNGAAGLDAPVEATFTFGGAVSLVMGIFILGVVLAPDMARWAKTPKQAMIAGFVGFFFGNSIILVVAIVLARVMNGTELMAIFFALGLGGVAVIVLILAQWTTNTTNLYSAGLAFAAISERLDRRIVTVVLGVIGIVVGVIGAADYFVQFILVIGVIIAPYGGVYLAAYFTGRKGARWAHDAAVPTVDGWSVAAWVAGILVAVATTNPADGPGFGWFTLTTISALDGLLVGFLVYLALVPLRRRTEPDAAASPHVEETARLGDGAHA